MLPLLAKLVAVVAAGLSLLGSAPGELSLARIDGQAGLFDGSRLLMPGGPPIIHGERVRLDGPAKARSAGFYITGFRSRTPDSSPLCRATDPASKLILRVVEGRRLLVEQTLSRLAAIHHSPPTMLRLAGGWSPGTVRSFVVSVRLDASAGNEYRGCVSGADFTWFAS